MLIVPVENRPDWRNPPLATLLLIVINVLVFFLYQAKDPQRVEAASTWYAQSGLFDREQRSFDQYLGRTEPALLQQLDAGDDDDAEGMAVRRQLQFQHSAYDPTFAEALHKEFAGDPQWQAARSQFEKLVNSISSQAYAFKVKEARWDTWISNLFLHGSFMHLLGNMVFLFLFGFALEIAVGRGVFLLLYLCSGVGATLLFYISELGSNAALLGASGAISGLMGMYTALYGRRKISFFYSVIFYAGHLRAPALIIFPVWVAYELVGAWYGNDGVGHWAHTGGLLFGFALLALWMRFGLKYDRDYVEKVDPDAPFKAALAQTQELMAALKLPEARKAAEQLVTAYPRDPRAWRCLYGVEKIAPASREYHQAVHSLFKQVGQAARNPAFQTLIEEVAHEYIRISGDAPAMTESVSLALAPRLARPEHIKPFAFLAERLLERQCRHHAMPAILQAVANLSAKAEQATQAQHYRAQLQARFPDSSEARQSAAYTAA